MIKILVRNANGEPVYETDFVEDYGTPSAHALAALGQIFGDETFEAFAEISENAPTRWYMDGGEDSTWYETDSGERA